jgi:ABC-type phosphate transport system permease subunit
MIPYIYSMTQDAFKDLLNKPKTMREWSCGIGETSDNSNVGYIEGTDR